MKWQHEEGKGFYKVVIAERHFCDTGNIFIKYNNGTHMHRNIFFYIFRGAEYEA